MAGYSRVRCHCSVCLDDYSDDEACRCGGKRGKIIEKDLLSSLPEGLICHIFSFMEIKDIVKTSVLSKRWRFTWHKTPAISFYYLEKISSFRKFHPNIDEVMMLCTSLTIRKFHLLCFVYHPSMKKKLDLWLRFAVTRHAEDIHLGFCSDPDYPHFDAVQFYDLTNTLLQCQSVVTLYLAECDFSLVSDQSRGISWSSLKVLHIKDTMVGDDVFNEILKGSPLLEYLKLERCHSMKHLRVHSRKLRELVIDRFRDSRQDNENVVQVDIDVSTLVITAPHLLVLRLCGFWAQNKVVNLDDVSSLVECELNLNWRAALNYESVVYNMLRRLFSKLTQVNKLVIGRRFLQMLHRVQLEAGFSPLDCRNLVLSTGADKWELAGIVDLLKITLSVEKLVIAFSSPRALQGSFLSGDNDSHDEEESRRSRVMKSISLLCHLKSIKILHFQAECVDSHRMGRWLSLINILLANAFVLEEMVINLEMPSLRLDKKLPVKSSRIWKILEVAREIMRYQRGSTACKVILNYPFIEELSCSASV